MKRPRADAARASWPGPAFVVALLLAVCLPATAQNLFRPARPAPPAGPTFSARLQSPPLLAVPSYSDHLMTIVPAHYRSHIESTMDYVETPFVQQTRLPLARLSSGRFELGSFDTLRPMENLLLGPPASGSLPAWSVATQVHPGVWVPLSDESYGLSLSINLKRGPQPVHQVQIWHCLGWVVGTGRGCHLN